jgi:hypothetical protein
LSNAAQFVVVTSIFDPTSAVQTLAELDAWELVVVADEKTPRDWFVEGARLLAVERQRDLPYRLAGLLPWNHYARKTLGYLYAIEAGAQLIWDTDDDNLPRAGWQLPTFAGEYYVLSGTRYVNVYTLFSDQHVWPRGYPLSRLLEEASPIGARRQVDVGIWQFLADGDPDVDAIYRLTDNRPIVFDQRPPVVLDSGSVCPFNSQNTVFRREVFPLLYLPSYVTFRFTDILRGIVAQPILWKYGYRLGFAAPTVVQDRNPHDLLRDFESEIPVYLHGERALEVVCHAVAGGSSTMVEDLFRAYQALVAAMIVPAEELALVEGWIEDLEQLGL